MATSVLGSVVSAIANNEKFQKMICEIIASVIASNEKVQEMVGEMAGSEKVQAMVGEIIFKSYEQFSDKFANTDKYRKEYLATRESVREDTELLHLEIEKSITANALMMRRALIAQLVIFGVFQLALFAAAVAVIHWLK